MFDMVNNEISTSLIREFHESQKIVSAVCHGSAALLNATLSDGSLLIKGERVTGFSNAEEIAVDRQKDMPFHLETALDRASGGLYEKASEPWAEKVIVSVSGEGDKRKRLLTGQNPASASAFAKELLKMLETGV